MARGSLRRLRASEGLRDDQTHGIPWTRFEHGNRVGYLRSAVEELDAAAGTSVTKRSKVYESEPDGPMQPNYFNMVVEVSTSLDPNQLLALCQKVENLLARERVQRWGPRTIDIDILLYDDLELHQENPSLIIPHPRMHTRQFVCVPLADVLPARKMPDTSGCIAGRIVREVGELYAEAPREPRE
ncbi:MAG: 2-amino-4-hydroxy-6-hydroxymethyldihydropteridine diphosphokinase [Actinobacteria bacterium]|nr:MAG: 2-amino-4-hydroxy-6-hydroxymethyldihydropteridine diphosphokinase [Actinomycetota bacterium]